MLVCLLIRKLDVFFDQFLTHYNKSDFNLIYDWEKVFGRDKIIVIDFYGSLKQNKGPHQVFACDILKVCNNDKNSSKYHYPADIHDNQSINVTQYQMFEVFRNFTTQQRCSFGGKQFKAELARFCGLHPAPIMSKFATPELLQYSLDVGNKIRARYKVINAVTEDVNKRLQYTEVDREQTLREPYRSKFRALLESMRQRHLTICSNADKGDD